MPLPYRHTQIGWAIIVPVATAEGGIVVLTVAGGATLFIPAAFSVLLAAVLVLFAWLTVSVDARALTLCFGLRGFRRTVAVAQIGEAGIVRNHWLSGWGIRVIPGGRLYNVSGRDAVELQLSDGQMVRVGTDEPARLLAAVEAAMARKEEP